MAAVLRCVVLCCAALRCAALRCCALCCRAFPKKLIDFFGLAAKGLLRLPRKQQAVLFG